MNKSKDKYIIKSKNAYLTTRLVLNDIEQALVSLKKSVYQLSPERYHLMKVPYIDKIKETRNEIDVYHNKIKRNLLMVMIFSNVLGLVSITEWTLLLLSKDAINFLVFCLFIWTIFIIILYVQGVDITETKLIQYQKERIDINEY
jgi:hypothetical protein